MTELVLLITFIAVCVLYYFIASHRKATLAKRDEEEKREAGNREEAVKEDIQKVRERPSDCCGAHAVCEKDTLLTTSATIEYYEDEELDEYIGREADSYTDEEIKNFEDVFYTLKENEVAGWLRSLQSRGISLPNNLKEEALLIVRERRFKDTNKKEV